jgi:hypothetical protein
LDSNQRAGRDRQDTVHPQAATDVADQPNQTHQGTQRRNTWASRHGSVECDVWNENNTTDQIKDSTQNITVYNWTTSAVCANGDRYGLAGWCNGAWYVIAEDCNDEGSSVQPGTGTGTGGTVADAIDTGTITPASMYGESYNINFTGTGTGSGPA